MTSSSSLGTRTLGRDGLVVSSIGLGCMGMSQSLRPGRPRRVDRDHPPRARPRRHVPRHRPTSTAAGTTRSWSGRRSPGAATRCSWPPSSRSPDDRGGMRIDGRPENVRACAEASLRRLGVDHDRPLLPAPASTRRCRSRTPSGRWPSWCSRARSATSGCPRRAPSRSAGPSPCTRSPRCRASGRCGPATWRRRSLRGRPRARRRHRALQPARPRFPHRRDHQPGGLRPTTTSAATSRGSRARPSRPTCGWWTPSASWPPRRACTPDSWRWPGCSRRATTSSPSRGPSGASYLEENAGAAAIELSSEELDRLSAIGSAEGTRYPDAGYAYGNSPERAG